MNFHKLTCTFISHISCVSLNFGFNRPEIEDVIATSPLRYRVDLKNYFYGLVTSESSLYLSPFAKVLYHLKLKGICKIENFMFDVPKEHKP